MSYQDAIQDSDIIDGLDVRYLKFFGLWQVINDYRTTGKKNNIIKTTVLISLLLAVPYVVFQFLSYFYIEVDIQKATFLNLNSLGAIQLCCRVFVFWIRIDSQSRLVNLMKKNFLVIPIQKQEAVYELYNEISKTTNFWCLTYILVNISVVILYIADPGVSVDYILYHTGNMDAVTTGRKKILGGWYPFPMNESPYYELIFLYESVCVLWAGVLIAVYFCLFFQVLCCLYAQFVVLGYDAQTFNFDLENGEMLHHYHLRLSDTFRRILQDHQNLLRYSDELRSVYNPLVTLTLGFGILVFIIGALQFLLGETMSPAFMFKMSKVFVFQGVEVFLYCFGSSFIEAASSDLQFAIYSSQWYKASKEIGKAVQMMMVGAKNGVRLTAIRMYPVNRETLMAILQFTYSTSTLMSRMTE
ncbi:odorant receptor 10-like [Halyomorpha halys]|uniref:odorant receptor 10-like n=1 Tax=Halyomorpha halys TaxID=286706 RepID=UPI0006D4F9D6